LNHVDNKWTKKAIRIDLHGAYVARTDLRGAILTNADLTDANATNVDFRGADMTGTILTGTILNGADLRDVIGLTVEQLESAVINEQTILPDYLDRAALA
jgi:uncharacterized protein YjbI with pentapeptide repeats